MKLIVIVACSFFVVSSYAQPGQEAESAPINGGEIAYVEKGDGEPVLLIHGGLIGLSSYEAIMAEPAFADYHLIRYARRGYPPSSDHVESTSLAQQAGDAANLLADLGVARAHVVAHSAGGPIAVQLAIDRPDLVQSLTLLEGGPFGTPEGRPPVPSAPTDGPPAFVSHALAADWEAAAAGFMDFLFGPDWRDEQEIASSGYLEEIKANMPMFFGTELAIYGAPVAANYYDGVVAPTAVIIGQLSVMAEAGAAPLTLIPQAERIDLLNAGHDMLTRKPLETAQAIAAFLARNPM